MGWWKANLRGGIDLGDVGRTDLPTDPSRGGLLNMWPDAPGDKSGPFWGDEPADVIERALDEIKQIFQRDWGRQPTVDELRRGFRFSLGGDEQ